MVCWGGSTFVSILPVTQHVDRKFISANGTTVRNTGYLITPMDQRTRQSIDSIFENHEFNQVSNECDNNINCALPTMYPYLGNYVYGNPFSMILSILWHHSNLFFVNMQEFQFLAEFWGTFNAFRERNSIPADRNRESQEVPREYYRFLISCRICFSSLCRVVEWYFVVF